MTQSITHLEKLISFNTVSRESNLALIDHVSELLEPLGFRIDEHAVRRAGLDYWDQVDLTAHQRLEQAEEAVRRRGAGRCWYLTGKASQSFHEVEFRPGDALVFGKESSGLPASVLRAHEPDLVAIPTFGAVRSLNLANAVSITLYEALRQNGALDGAVLRAKPFTPS